MKATISATAGLLAALVAALAWPAGAWPAGAAMYRCGNAFQDRP